MQLPAAPWLSLPPAWLAAQKLLPLTAAMQLMPSWTGVELQLGPLMGAQTGQTEQPIDASVQVRLTPFAEIVLLPDEALALADPLQGLR